MLVGDLQIGPMQMRIRAGYELVYECPKPTPMLLVLNIHPSRRGDLLTGRS
jgi:hypothetical protein